jgi:hypothetical protein
MGKVFTFTGFGFLEKLEADLEACFDDMLNEEELQVQKGPSDDSLDRILAFAKIYGTADVDCFGIAEIYKN